MHLGAEDVGRIGLGKVLAEAPRGRAEPVGDPQDRAALCLLRRDDGPWLAIEFVPWRRTLYLVGRWESAKPSAR